MKNKSLNSLTKEQLLKRARNLGLAVKPNQLKNAIIKAIEQEENKTGSSSRKATVKKSGKKSTASRASSGQGISKKKAGAPSKASSKSSKRKTESKGQVRSSSPSKPRAKSPTPAKSGGKGKSKTGHRARPSALRAAPESTPQNLAHTDLELEAKFRVAQPDAHDESTAEPIPELPEKYGRDTLVILPRDPYWVFVYWEVADRTFHDTVERLHCAVDDVRWILRVSTPFQSGFTDTEVGPTASSWYLHLSRPGTGVKAQLGLKNPEGTFEPLVLSNQTALPLDRPSDREEEHWVWTDETFQLRGADQPEGNALPDFSRPGIPGKPGSSGTGFSSHNLQRKR